MGAERSSHFFVPVSAKTIIKKAYTKAKATPRGGFFSAFGDFLPQYSSSLKKKSSLVG